MLRIQKFSDARHCEDITPSQQMSAEAMYQLAKETSKEEGVFKTRLDAIRNGNMIVNWTEFENGLEMRSN